MLIKVLATKEVYTAEPDIPEPIYTAEPDIPEPIYTLEVELAIKKLKKHKATRVDRIPSELIQAGGGKLYEEI